MRSRAGDYEIHAIAREFKEYNVRRMKSELSALDIQKWRVFFKIETELIKKRQEHPDSGLSVKEKLRASLGGHYGGRGQMVRKSSLGRDR